MERLREKKDVIIVSIVALALTALTVTFITLYVLSLRKAEEPQITICKSPDCVKAAATILHSMNTSADPCEDFYEYACGRYKVEKIDENSNFSPFSDLDHSKMRRLRLLLENPPTNFSESPSRKKMRRFYQSCITNNASSSLKKMVEIAEDFAEDSEMPLGKTIAKLNKKWSTDAFFQMRVVPDPFNVTRMNVIAISQSGLNMAKHQYSNKEALALQEKIMDMVAKAIFPVHSFRIGEILKFEKKLAEIQQDEEPERAFESYETVKLSWLQETLPQFHWRGYFKEMFTFEGKNLTIPIENDEPILLTLKTLSYLKNLGQVLDSYLLEKKKDGKSTIMAYFVFRALFRYAPYLTSLVPAKVGETKTGEQTVKFCISDMTSNIFGVPLAAIYVEQYFPKMYKERANFIVSKTIASFTNRIQQANWLDEKTKHEAIKKMISVRVEVGYPDWLLNGTYIENELSDLPSSRDYMTTTVDSLRFTLSHFNLEQLRKLPNPRHEWPSLPYAVNAFNKQDRNTLFVLAGILQQPIFYEFEDTPSALNFGAIGSIAGHEVAHSFDPNGRQYDMDGNLRNWWANASDEEYWKKADCFIEQYNRYKTGAGFRVNGSRTLSENIADSCGVNAAYDAFKKSGDNKGLVGLQFSPEHLFFVSLAQPWCSVSTRSQMAHVLRYGTYAPNKFRLIGALSNSQDFAKAFNCPVGSPMNPKKKCLLW